MSDCDWLGMGVFGTQALGPGPNNLPSTIIQATEVRVDVDDAVSVAQAAGGIFTNVTRNGTGDTLAATFTRQKVNRPVLVTLSLTGFATGFTGPSPINFRIMANTNPVFTRTGDSTNVLLARSVFVNTTGAAIPPFTLLLSALVPPALVTDTAQLQLVVQFRFTGANTATAVLNVDPKVDALVVQEIGRVSL